VCVLEYDVHLHNFEQFLYPHCNTTTDVISFIIAAKRCLTMDSKYVVCVEYLNQKGLSHREFDCLNVWTSTTNHCMKRTILDEFVDWYYPSCLFIKDKDYQKLGYYHERMFAVYCHFKEYKHIVIHNILQHLQLLSHKT
jgi:hypothetical protein